jgi:hypothetical protein
MKIERLFIGLMGLLVVFFVLSVTTWKNSGIDIHLYDTYYVISSAYIAIFSLFAAQINYMLYKLIGDKEGVLSHSILLLHLLFFLTFLLLISGLGFSVDYLQYQQSSLLIWAVGAFFLSELLIAIYHFLPERKAQ